MAVIWALVPWLCVKEKNDLLSNLCQSLCAFFSLALDDYHIVLSTGSIARTHDKLTVYAQKLRLGTSTILQEVGGVIEFSCFKGCASCLKSIFLVML